MSDQSNFVGELRPGDCGFQFLPVARSSLIIAREQDDEVATACRLQPRGGFNDGQMPLDPGEAPPSRILVRRSSGKAPGVLQLTDPLLGDGGRIKP